MKFILTRNKDPMEVLDGELVTEEITYELKQISHYPFAKPMTHQTLAHLSDGSTILDPFGPNITLLRTDGSFENLSPKLIRLEP